METTTERPSTDPRLEETIARPGRARMRPLLTFFAVVALVVIGAIIAGLLPRLERSRGLQAAVQAERNQIPVVNVTAARTASSSTPLDLPGDLQALIESPIYARVNGYLIKRYVDFGDHVKKGQPMADIETPELDQQIQQARATLSNSVSSLKESEADLALATANLNLSRETAKRWVALEAKGAVSHQETDEKRADLEVKQAQVDAARAKIVATRDLVNANEADLRRLNEMKTFSHITAPFDGVVTARNVDVGTLINAGNGGTANAMFSVAQSGTMRIFVNVPQAYVPSVRVGETAEMRVQELPGEVFHPVVTRSSREVDTASRSMLAILEVANPKGALLPGMYTQVRFAGVVAPRGTVLIPGEALVLTTAGPRVGVVDAGRRVHFHDVKLGNDYGSEVEVQSGLSAGDLVILNPTDAVRDGVEVEPRTK